MSMTGRGAIALLMLVAASMPALAVQPDEVLPDPQLETRARALSRELRCMVCQNQSIDDSDAPLARDLRILVRERITAGDGDAQVLDYLVARYGAFVLLRPRFQWQTAALWLTPVIAFALGGAGLMLLFRAQRRRSGGAGPSEKLDAAEEARIAELTSGGNGQGR